MSALEATPEVQTVPFFFINHHSDLKMVTSPVKLCCLLPSPSPTPSSLRSRLQPRGRHEILERCRLVYIIPPLPALAAMTVLHFYMISFLISNVALPSGPRDFYEESPKHALLSSVSRTYCHVSIVFIKLSSVSKNQILFCGDTSL